RGMNLLANTHGHATSAKKLTRLGKLTAAFPASCPRASEMKLLKTKPQPKPVEIPLPLSQRIKETCDAAEQYIQSKVRQLKASDDGRLLPIGWLESDLRRRHGSLGCHCKVALSLLEEDNND